MHILMPTPRFYPESGGVESHVFQVGRRIVLKGHTVTVLTTDRSQLLPAVETIEGIFVKRVPAWPAKSDFYFAPDIYKEVLKSDYDIAHVQSYHTFVPPFAMLAALRAQKPYVLTFHGGGHSSSLRHAARTLQRGLLRPLLARAKRLIAVAPFEIGMFAKELNLPRERFALIPNGADLPQIKKSIRAEPVNESLIVSVGRLERYKGHQHIIAALPEVLKRKPNTRVWIAGSGPYERNLRDLAARLGVQDKVEIRAIPAEERVKFAEEISQAALFVLFSEYETHPIAVLEAVSLGCPALVADSPGLRDLAEDGLAKSMPFHSSSKELAEEIIEQLEHPRVVKGINLPTWDDCANDLLSLYQSILEA